MNPPGTISPVGAWLDQDFISVAGPEAESFLHGQVSQDIQALAPMAGALSLVLSPQGKVDAIVRVIRVDVEQFVILVDQPFGQAVIERLSRFRLRTKVTIEPLSQWRALAVRGPLVDQEPGSDRWAQRLGAQLVVSDSWGGSIGIIAVGPALDVGSEVEILTRQVWEHLRIEGGRVRFGIDVLPGAIPAETGLLERAVSFTKGCYTGQELVARMDSRGNRTPRRLCRFVASAEAGEREGFVGGHGLALTVEGSHAEGEVLGTVTSVAAPGWRSDLVGLAVVNRHADVPGPARLVRTEDGDQGFGLGAWLGPLDT